MLCLEIVPLFALTALFTLMAWLPMSPLHKGWLSLGVLLFLLLYSYGVNFFIFRLWAAKERAIRVNYEKNTLPSPYEGQGDKLQLYLSILGTIVLPTSIVVSIVILYLNNRIGISIPAWIMIIACACWLYYVYSMFKGLGYAKIEVFPSDYSVTYRPHNELIRQLDDALKNLVATTSELRRQEQEVTALSIPQLPTAGNAKVTPFIDYVNSIGNIKKSYPQLASLEQLVLSVTHFDNIQGWADSLENSISAGAHLTSSGANYVADTVKNFTHFIKSPDKETWTELLHNIGERMSDADESPKLKLKLVHAHNLTDYLKAFGNEAGKDIGLGTFDTFSASEAMMDVKDNLDDSIHSLEVLGEHFVPTIDLSGINVFEPDFDFTAHLPIISMLKETFTNISRAEAGNVDMTASLWHSTTKVAGKAGGAYLGAAIGSILLPGAGTIIGGMLGAMAGNWGAKKFNARKFEALKEEYETEQANLQSILASAETAIESKQSTVNVNITKVVQEQQDIFDKAKTTGAFSKWSKSHILSPLDLQVYSFSYIIYGIIWETAMQYSAKSKKYNPEKYSLLLNLLPDKESDISHLDIDDFIPSKHTYKCGSKASLLSMIDGYMDLVKAGTIRMPNYYDIDEVCRMFIGMIESQITIMHARHIGWLNSIQQKYILCISEMLNKSEAEFKELKKVIDCQQATIKNQSDKCADIARRAKKESETL